VPFSASNSVVTYFGIFRSHYDSSVGSVQYRLQNVNHSSKCILEGADCRASGIEGYIPRLLKYKDFWFVSYILMELYCISYAHLDVLKVNM